MKSLTTFFLLTLKVQLAIQENGLGQQLYFKNIFTQHMWMICRHPIVETLARHGFDAIRGATTSPFEIEHNRFQKNWNSLCQKIDYANLSKFDWKVVLGTTMETQAQEASSFCNACP